MKKGCVFCRKKEELIDVYYNERKIIKVCKDCLDENLDIIGMDETGKWEFVDNVYLQVYKRNLENY